MKKLFFVALVLLNTCSRKMVGDFNGLTWGASLEDVIKKEGRKPDETQKDLYVYSKTLSGVPVQLGYIFVGKELASAAYIPKDAGSARDQTRKTYLRLTDSLTKIYGPSQDTTLEENTKYKKTWHTPTSNIYLYYYMESFLLNFTSKRLEPLINMDPEPDPADSTNTIEIK